MATPTSYLFIETRDPFVAADVEDIFALADRLGATAPVSVYLAENGVLAARGASSAGRRVTELAARVTVLVDDFSQRERGIGPDELAPGVEPASIDRLVDLVTTKGCRALWH